MAFAVDRPASGRTPLWAMAMTAALLVWGFGGTRDASMTSRQNDGRSTGDQARGRLASTPSEIPARGWKDILLRVYGNIGEDRVMLVAAGVTFYSLLAIFPAITALVALYGLFADPTSISSHVDSLSGMVPSGVLEVIRNQMHHVVAQGHTKLGFAFLIGLVISLWSANAGIKSIFDALNLVYDEPEKRGFIKLNLVSLTFTFAAIAFVLIAIGAIVALPAVFASTGASGAMALVVKIARWPALLVIIALALAVIYRYGPSRHEPKWRWITWGSAFAAFGWIVVSILFSFYTANFADYNKTYGSLGAIIAFMFWLWLATTVILLGAEIDAEMEHQTVRDTTTGGGRPLGTRGATMADTVGRAQS